MRKIVDHGGRGWVNHGVGCGLGDGRSDVNSLIFAGRLDSIYNKLLYIVCWSWFHR